MTRKELIAQCRYYTGGEDNPNEGAGNMEWFWEMECLYVNSGGVFEGEREYYEAIGGKKYPGIPYTLLIIMFTSWGKWTYDIQHNIGKFYDLIDEYLSIPDAHFPKDKIPPEGFRHSL